MHNQGCTRSVSDGWSSRLPTTLLRRRPWQKQKNRHHKHRTCKRPLPRRQALSTAHPDSQSKCIQLRRTVDIMICTGTIVWIETDFVYICMSNNHIYVQRWVLAPAPVIQTILNVYSTHVRLRARSWLSSTTTSRYRDIFSAPGGGCPGAWWRFPSPIFFDLTNKN